ncbi:MAG: DUF2141 domain-containing protein [Rhizobiaceae bacterium]|nr:DUF2141 domain-containing protein [Rhizobiaceae bacterium]
MPVRPTLAALSLVCLATPSPAADLAVTIEGLRTTKGLVSICVFARSADFPDCGAAPPAMRLNVRADSVSEPVVFEGLDEGVLAIAVLHDENGNGRLDTNFLGIPNEGVGISTNRLPRFSAPAFEDAAFRFDGGSGQSVKLVYW